MSPTLTDLTCTVHVLLTAVSCIAVVNHPQLSSKDVDVPLCKNI